MFGTQTWHAGGARCSAPPAAAGGRIQATAGLSLGRLPAADLPLTIRLLAVTLVPTPWLVLPSAAFTQADPRSGLSSRSGTARALWFIVVGAHGSRYLPRKAPGRTRERSSRALIQNPELDQGRQVYLRQKEGDREGNSFRKDPEEPNHQEHASSRRWLALRKHSVLALCCRSVPCDGQTDRHIHFWAESEAEEASAWKGFVDLIDALGDFALSHYGSYETRFISNMAKKDGIPPAILERLEGSCTNVLSKLYAHVYLPVYSNDLKSVATFLGFKWSAEGASGIQSIAWRAEWENGQSDTIKRKLLSYNQEDCQALRLVSDTLRLIASNKLAAGSGMGSITQAEDLKREHPYGFGRNAFFFPELDIINKCAYFDYQRERIYVRTSKAVKDSVRREHRRQRAIKLNKTISCSMPDQCQLCLSNDVIKHGGISKIVYDMKLFAGGIKRWVVRYTSWRCFCKSCGRTFVPMSFQARTDSKYGHTLLAWSVYRNIELRQSHGAIRHELTEIFGYELSFDIAARLKVKAASHYESTYAKLQDHLKSGKLIHADETKVSIKGLEGYVWAFTNLQEVVYVYSETRDRDTPCKMLDGFSGFWCPTFIPLTTP